MGITITVEKTIICDSCRRHINKYEGGLLIILEENRSVSKDLGRFSKDEKILTFEYKNFELFEEKLVYGYEQMENEMVIHANYTCLRDCLSNKALTMNDWTGELKKANEPKAEEKAAAIEENFPEAEQSSEMANFDTRGSGFGDKPF